MCTLICAFKMFPRWPLVIAANRDERLDRPATAPRLWPGEQPFIAPRDESAGGTWLGLNSVGMFLGVTNRYGAPKDDRRKSRGALVVEALRAPSFQALETSLAVTQAGAFNAFHLLYADRSRAGVTWSDGTLLKQGPLSPGLHIITERSLGGDDRARTELIRERWPSVGKDKPSEEALANLLRIHGGDAIGGTCIHADALGYGTRSSMILLLGDSIATSRFLWAEGHPCTAAHVPQPELMRALQAA